MATPWETIKQQPMATPWETIIKKQSKFCIRPQNPKSCQKILLLNIFQNFSTGKPVFFLLVYPVPLARAPFHSACSSLHG